MKKRLVLAWQVLRGRNPRAEGYTAAMQNIDESLEGWLNVRIAQDGPAGDPLTARWYVRYDGKHLSTGDSIATVLLCSPTPETNE